ncbi:MAG TPA: hypothetical protein VFV66_19400, partial [Nonomuraea sp.]|nr:hypothetical protein [Nonomuraea sp.]
MRSLGVADEFGARVLRQVFRTSRGRALLGVHFLAAFGAVSAVLLYGVPFGRPGVAAACRPSGPTGSRDPAPDENRRVARSPPVRPRQ